MLPFLVAYGECLGREERISMTSEPPHRDFEKDSLLELDACG